MWPKTKTHVFSYCYYVLWQTCPDADGSLHSNLICPVNVSSQPGRSLPDIQTTQQAITMLDKLSQNKKPFFLAVGLHKPHVPFKYPQKYLSMFFQLTWINDEGTSFCQHHDIHSKLKTRLCPKKMNSTYRSNLYMKNVSSAACPSLKWSMCSY